MSWPPKFKEGRGHRFRQPPPPLMEGEPPFPFMPFGGPSSGNKGIPLPPTTMAVEVEDLSPVARLWLESRQRAERDGDAASQSGPYRPKGEDRPMTIANCWIAVQLVGLLWGRFLAMFWEGNRHRVMMYLIRRLLQGVLPALKLWARSELLDLVQRSFEEPLATRDVLIVAGRSILLVTGEDIYHFFARTSDNQFRTQVNYTMERAYLASQMSLSIPALSSPFASALTYEAGCFCGVESHISRKGVPQRSGGPFATLSSVFNIMTITVELVTQTGLLLTTIAAASKESHFTWSNLLLILLSLSPSGIRLIGSFLFGDFRRGRRSNIQRMRLEEREVRQIGLRGEFKQEVALFGLKDWVLEKWDYLRKQQLQEQEDVKGWQETVELGLGLSTQSVETAFYVLLALRLLSTSLSLGSIRLYQSTATSLLNSVYRFRDSIEQAFQSIFYFAAFCETTTDPEAVELAHRKKMNKGIPLISYEDVRMSSGMKIQAIKMGFTYPGANTPTLHDINLTLLPGETLAIVGLNGGGKTTLVKALLGLYDHTGELYINDRLVEAYDPQSLHARTSCLFQDFSKYSLTLRENVGVGNVTLMEEDAQIEEALHRGGAEGVREKLGLEGRLNRHGVPDVSANAEEGTGLSRRVVQSESDSDLKRRKEMVKAPAEKSASNGTAQTTTRTANGGGSSTPKGEVRNGKRQHEKDDQKDDTVKPAALSGGQWQRVALARAFLRADQADLVVFDEPSSSLDPRAEAQLFQRIHNLSSQNGDSATHSSKPTKPTTIYISHRFSTVKKADRIAVVDDGTIVELGTHLELMELGGRYAELFNLQREAFD